MQRSGLIIGSPNGQRIGRFQQALEAAGNPTASVIAYPQWIRLTPDQRRARMRSADWIRLESPERDEACHHAIQSLCRVRPPGEPTTNGYPDKVAHPKGLLIDPQAFNSGFHSLMQRFEHDEWGLKTCRFLNHPQQIMLACKKASTKALLNEFEIPTPYFIADNLDSEAGYDSVVQAMRAAGRSRVFIKLRQGSAGSGVVAYQCSGSRELAITTVAMQRLSDGIRLYNTRQIQRYSDPQDIRLLLDTLVPMGVIVEEWFPKAGVSRRVCDLRVVTVAGRVTHTVLRLSRHPITNLHLRNDRSEPEALRKRMRPEDWDAMIDTCEKTAREFPKMLYLGIDVAVHADLKRHAVLEVNAFGDLLNGVTQNGRSTYDAEVAALPHWNPNHARPSRHLV